MGKPNWYYDSQARHAKLLNRQTTDLSDSLDLIQGVAQDYFNMQDKAFNRLYEQEKQFENANRVLRQSEVARLRAANPEPEFDPLNFGNPVMNAEDYTNYLTAVGEKNQAIRSGMEFIPPHGGHLSKTAQRDLFQFDV